MENIICIIETARSDCPCGYRHQAPPETLREGPGGVQLDEDCRVLVQSGNFLYQLRLTNVDQAGKEEDPNN